MPPAVIVRRGIVATLLGIAWVASAGAVHAAPPTPAPQGFAPFDLTYLPGPGPHGVLAFRPAVIMRHVPVPPLGVGTRLFLGMLLSRLADCDLAAAEPPALTDLDECVLGLSLSATCQTAKERGKLVFGAGTPGCLRTAKPFDWAGAVRKWFRQAIPTEHAGRTYLRIPWKVDPSALSAEFKKKVEGRYLAAFIPDGRTLVIGDECQIEGLIDRLKAGKALPEPPGWHEVNRDLVALALDQRQLPCVQGTWPQEPPEVKDVRALAEAVRAAAVGVAVREGADGGRVVVRLVATTTDAASGGRAATAIKALWAAARAAVDQEIKGAMPELVRMVHEVFDRGTLTREGAIVRGRMDVPVQLLRLGAAAAAATTKAKAAPPPPVPAPPPPPSGRSNQPDR